MQKLKARFHFAPEPKILIKNYQTSELILDPKILMNKTFKQEASIPALKLMIPQNARNEAGYDDSLSPISYSTGLHNFRPPFSSDSNWGAKRQHFRTFY
jgi:hypothetical protein